MVTNGPIEIVREWPTVSLADVTTKIGSGATPRGGSEAYLDARVNYALIRSQNVFDRRFDPHGLAYISDEQAAGLRGVVVRPGDVLLNITGDGVTFGRACLAPQDVLPACVNQHVAIVRANPEKADPGYLLAFLTHADVKPYIASFNSGGSRRAVTKGHIESFRLPLPPLAEQRAIAATLGALDDRLESNRRVVELALASLDALAAHVGDKAPSIPLLDLVAVSRDTVDPTRLGDQSVDHYSLPAFDLGARPERVPASSIMSNKLSLSRPSILVSRLNPRFNRTWWVRPEDGIASLASTEFSPLTADTPEALAGVWLAVRDEFFRTELARRVTGTSGSHQRVRPDDMLSIDVPDVRLLPREITEQALALLNVSEQRRREIADLEVLRDAVLRDLLSGRIRAVAEAAS